MNNNCKFLTIACLAGLMSVEGVKAAGAADGVFPAHVAIDAARVAEEAQNIAVVPQQMGPQEEVVRVNVANPAHRTGSGRILAIERQYNLLLRTLTILQSLEQVANDNNAALEMVNSRISALIGAYEVSTRIVSGIASGAVGQIASIMRSNQDRQKEIEQIKKETENYMVHLFENR